MAVVTKTFTLNCTCGATSVAYVYGGSVVVETGQNCTQNYAYTYDDAYQAYFNSDGTTYYLYVGEGGGVPVCNDYACYPCSLSEVSPPTPSASPSPSPTPTPSSSTVPPPPSIPATPSVTPSTTPPATPESTPTPTPTISSTPGASPTPTPSVSNTPGASVTPSVTPSITPTPTPSPVYGPGTLGIYTPWIVAKTNDPVWAQGVYPVSTGVTQYSINWGDNSTYSTYNSLGNTNNYFLYTYNTPASGNSYYTLSATVTQGVTALPRGLVDRFYIKDSLPTFESSDYFDPTEPLSLPYSLSEVYIGSNEWVVSDVINASFSKLNTNFNFLKAAAQALKLDNELLLIEWCAQLVPVTTSNPNENLSAFAWKTDIDGLDEYSQFTQYATGSALGIADGVIKDIKSYRFSTATAPDYYTYVAFSASGSVPDHIQIRTNDYYNTLVLSAGSLGPNIPSFTSLSAIDVLNNQLYILDNTTVYRVGTTIATTNDPINAIGNLTSDLVNSKFTILNQVGGVSATKDSYIGFNRPTEIRGWNDKLYVADSDNSCVKVYNTALSWLNTIYTEELSAYSVERIEINRTNEDLYLLCKTFAPVPPVLTSVTLVSALSTVDGDATQYRITFTHDGLRLQDNTTNVLSAFSLYGLISGASNYTELTSAVMASATAVIPYTSPQTVYYTATSGIKFEGFRVQALGNSGYTSDLSNSNPSPTNYTFDSPFKMFVYDVNGMLTNAFDVPNDTAFFARADNIQSHNSVRKIVIDPTGVFLYIITQNSVYKYLTDGTTLNKLTLPSKNNLGGYEELRSGYIDDRLNFFVATEKRIFKFLDLPDTLDLYDAVNVDTLFIPLSSIYIDKNEYVQDWVYNKSLLRILQNHEILYKTIRRKYRVNLDSNGNLTETSGGAPAFITTSLSSTDLITNYNIDYNNFIHSNELVTNSVVNRALARIYSLQEEMLSLITPRVIRALPSANTNTFN